MKEGAKEEGTTEKGYKKIIKVDVIGSTVDMYVYRLYYNSTTRTSRPARPAICRHISCTRRASIKLVSKWIQRGRLHSRTV